MADFNSSLPIRTENAGDVAVKLVDGTNAAQAASVDANGLLSAKIADAAGNALTSQASGIQRALDVGINVAGVQIDPRSIRALSASDVVSANMRDSAGASVTVGQKASAASLPVVIASDQSPIPVSISASSPGTEINDYSTATVAANGTSNHDYSVTSSKAFKGKKFWASSSGKLKIEVQISPDGSAFSTKFVAFNSVSSPNISIDMDMLTVSDSGAGAKVRIIRTNLDKASEDVYSTICGVEV